MIAGCKSEAGPVAYPFKPSCAVDGNGKIGRPTPAFSGLSILSRWDHAEIGSAPRSAQALGVLAEFVPSVLGLPRSWPRQGPLPGMARADVATAQRSRTTSQMPAVSAEAFGTCSPKPQHEPSAPHMCGVTRACASALTALALLAASPATHAAEAFNEAAMRTKGLAPLDDGALKQMLSRQRVGTFVNLKTDGEIEIAPDASIRIRGPWGADSGTWRVHDGRLCVTYPKVYKNVERCHRLFEFASNQFHLFLVSGDYSVTMYLND